MSALVTADLHLTSSPKDSHRWGIFPWLVKQANKFHVSEILLLGDITDAKDHHPSVVTNKIVDGFVHLSKEASVYFNPGNHDGIDENNIYFTFVERLEGVIFIRKPEAFTLSIGPSLILPNTRDYESAWADLDFSKFKLIFTHQTYDGCKSESGFTLSGIPPSVFGRTKAKVYSGDIHKPQRVGKNIEYVGSPYHVRFGDDFEPRVLLIQDDGTTKDLHFPTKNKLTIDLDYPIVGKSIFDKLYEGDQVKVRVKMRRSEYAEWPSVRAEIVLAAEQCGVELTGPELLAAPERQKSRSESQGKQPSGFAPAEALAAYAESKGVSGALLEAVKELLKEAMK